MVRNKVDGGECAFSGYAAPSSERGTGDIGDGPGAVIYGAGQEEGRAAAETE